MKETYKLSAQAVGSLMMAIQSGIMAAATGKSKEECDITGLILGLELENTVDGLVVLNPPTVSGNFEEFEGEEDADV